MRKTGKIAVRVLILALFFSQAVIAESGLFAQQILMVNEVWAPYRIGTNDKPHEWTGIDIDLVRELEKRLNIKVTITSASWARCLEMIRNNQADMLTGVAWTEERTHTMLYVPTSYSTVQPVFYTKKGRENQLKSYEDLRGLTIGQSISSAYFEPYNSDASINKLHLKDEIIILKMLESERIDLAIGTEPNISWDVAQNGLRGVLVPTRWQPEQKTALFIVFSSKWKDSKLIEDVNRAIKDMISDGTITAIHAKYK
ncbi:ABC transporter substrate-binding protein [Gracilinema caldarium]|uniref:substrate-binding periplasmic protein n=1 Tax=Gracilinema caldarium TaxID=215591 RepID=UPI0026F2290C|nr:transporter substrate-binding domain-containing protein [Gracilinema caldarium]